MLTPKKTIPKLAVAMLALAGCGGDGGIKCEDLAPQSPESFGCADPDTCLAVKATWNFPFPGGENTLPSDMDLTLELPDDGGVVGDVTGTTNPEGGCVHGGDEGENTEETFESIICERPKNGDYVIVINEALDLTNFGLSVIISSVPTPVRVDINNHGVMSCEVVYVSLDPDTTAKFPLTYP